MAKNLVIVESPSKAKTIEKILGSNYEVIASIGHVIDLPKTKIGIDIENNFKPEYKVMKDKKSILETLKSKSKKATKVFLASDLDREGEAIAWHISNYINQDDKVQRIEFNEITKTAISNAIRHPRKINIDLVNSQQARRLLDRLVGYKISPMLWPNIGRNASAGRVQSVALKLVCDLEDEIIKFISQKYFELSILIKYNIELSLSSVNGEKIDKIYDKSVLDEALKKLEGNDVEIVELEVKNKTQKPPYVFKTSTLQQLASSYLGFNARKTMLVAQKLYEGLNIAGDIKGLITYMRTDSIRVSDEAKIQAKTYIENKYGKEYVGNYSISKSSKNIQDAHEGIRPTYVNLEPDKIKEYLSNDEYRLYKLIWDRFIVSQFASVKYEQMQIKAKEGDYEFKGTINKIIFDGYYKIYKDEEAIKTADFPELIKGSKYNILELLVKEGETKAPSRYTEATLIKKLEALGIGRPSTYASIIEAIKEKKYVDLLEKRLVPTVFGREVKNELENNFKNIMNVKFTASMETKLDEIASGNLEWIELLKEFYGSLEKEIKDYKEKSDVLKNSIIKTDMKCSNCDFDMILKTGSFGKYIVCETDPKDKISIKGIEISEEEIKTGFVKIKDKLENLLEVKKGLKTDVYTENNKMYLLKQGRFGEYLESEDYATDNLRKPLSKDIKLKLKKGIIKSEDGIIKLKELLENIENSNNEILKNAGKCEKCGSDFVVKTGRYGKFLACSSYPDCKNIKKISKEKEDTPNSTKKTATKKATTKKKTTKKTKK